MQRHQLLRQKRLIDQLETQSNSNIFSATKRFYSFSSKKASTLQDPKRRMVSSKPNGRDDQGYRNDYDLYQELEHDRIPSVSQKSRFKMAI